MAPFGPVQPVRWKMSRSLPMPAVEAWNIFADTDRFSRVRNADRLQVEERLHPSGEVLRRIRAGGGEPYIEEPFEWEEGSYFSVVRRYESGLLLGYRWSMRFDGDTAPSSIDVCAEMYPRYPWVRPVSWLFQRLVLARQIDSTIGLISTADHGRVPAPAQELARAKRARIEQAAAALIASGSPASLVDGVMDQVLNETDVELLHMRPLALADALGVDRAEAVSLFLSGTRQGAFELRWSLVCPLCRGPKAEVEDLSRLQKEAHCGSCNISFGAEFERNVQVTFRPAASLRPLTETYACIGGPARTPHVLGQGWVRAGETARLTSAWPPSLPRPALLRCWAAAAKLRIDGPGRFRLSDEGFVRIDDDSGVVITNVRSVDHRVSIVDPTDSDAVLTAAEVIAMPAFRDLLSQQTLAPEMAVELRPMTFLFTDLKASTAMYEEVGDAEAFGRVKAHFDVLNEALAEHRGELVKTIGDAVMATFDDPVDALNCAVAMQQRVSERTGLTIKVGLHHGRAMCVTLNDRLDFFGATVNRAARMEGQARGGDVVLSATVAGDPMVKHALAKMPFASERLSVQVRGVEEAMEVLRLKVVNDV